MRYTNPQQNYDDPHRFNRKVHFRLYNSEQYGPTVICVQDFDYLDYDGRKFLSPEAWDEEQEAEDALTVYLRQRDGKLILRAMVGEALNAGDVVDVVQDPLVGTLMVFKYRQPID
jgi:uncharacterized Zn ribbon protein